MNKKISKAFLAIVLCLVTILAVPNVEVEAAAPKVNGAKTISTGSNYEFKIQLPKKLKQKQVKMSKSKSSNKKVAYAPYGEYNPKTGIYSFEGYAPKIGKAKISFDLKVKNKTHKYSMTITVKKYTNPVKSLKIGNKELAKAFNKKSLTFNPSTDKVIKVTPKKGWKLVSIVGRRYRGQTPVYTTIKNNTLLQKKDVGLYVTLKNAKTGVVQKLTIDIIN